MKLENIEIFKKLIQQKEAIDKKIKKLDTIMNSKENCYKLLYFYTNGDSEEIYDTISMTREERANHCKRLISIASNELVMKRQAIEEDIKKLD